MRLTGDRIVALVTVAWIALALPLASSAGAATTQDTRAIQAREALRADVRLLAYFDRFKAALTERFGADPWLSRMAVGENEAEALVHAQPGAPAEHVIFQEGKWIGTDGRKLAPWITGTPTEAQLFRLSGAAEAQWRSKLRAHRAVAAHATDFVTRVDVGYFGPPVGRLLFQLQVIGMSGSGLSSLAFDMSGKPIDVDGMVMQSRATRFESAQAEAAANKAASSRNLLAEIETILAEFRQKVGPARLMAVEFRRNRVTFIQADRAIVDYDQRGRFARRNDPYSAIWLCTEGFDDREVAWSQLQGLIDKAVAAGNLDDEDKPHAEITVERPRECRPVSVEVKFTNYVLPWPGSTFDAQGRYLRTSR